MRWNQRAHYCSLDRPKGHIRGPKGHIRGPKGHSALWKRPSENLDHRMNWGFPILVCLVIKPTPIEALVIHTFKNDILHFEIISAPPVGLESSNKALGSFQFILRNAEKHASMNSVAARSVLDSIFGDCRPFHFTVFCLVASTIFLLPYSLELTPPSITPTSKMIYHQGASLSKYA